MPWRYLSGSTLAQEMACCLTAPSHYLNQLIIKVGVCHSPEGNITRSARELKPEHVLEDYVISTTCAKGQWVNSSNLVSECPGGQHSGSLWQVSVCPHPPGEAIQWSLLLSVQLTITQHWCRWWLGVEQVTSHCLNQWWHCSLMPRSSPDPMVMQWAVERQYWMFC